MLVGKADLLTGFVGGGTALNQCFDRKWGWGVYISVAAVTAAYGSALTAGHFWQTPGMPAQPKVTKRSLPHHSVPRLGSACRNEGPFPRAAPPCLLAAIVVNGARRSRSKADQEHGGLKADLSGRSKGKSRFSVGAGLPAMRTTRSFRYTEAMPSPASQLLQWTVVVLDFDVAFASPHSSRPVGRCAFAVDLLLILILGGPLRAACVRAHRA
ncbi:hypothetical protein M2399_001103 [Pseudomonas sp. BIGb0450]|nr:hypothetical protein [Pseudomonas sp. BIGb0558]MCS3435682.1 hypothetical protein [Pseudomonas sp. BIGb0450]